MSENAQPVAPTPGGLGSGFTRLARKPVPPTPAGDTAGAPSTTEPAGRPTKQGQAGNAAKDQGATKNDNGQRPAPAGPAAQPDPRGSGTDAGTAPVAASDTVAVLRRTLFLPDDVFDALALRRASTRLTNSNLVLLALDALHQRLPELVAQARRPAQPERPTSLFGSMPVLTRIDGSGGRRQISVLWSGQVLETVDELAEASGAANRSQMVSVVLREWLREELDAAEKP